MVYVTAALVGLSSLASYGFYKRFGHLTKQIPPFAKDHLWAKVSEIMYAYYTAAKIEDPTTKELHVDTVALLSSSWYARQSHQLAAEVEKISTRYFAGYLYEVFEENQGMNVPVFRYSKNLDLAMPNGPFDGFIFSGSLSQLHDVEARKDILEGRYQRYREAVIVKNPEEENGLKYREIDLILTGEEASDKSRALHFDADLIRDIAYSAAKQKIPHDHPSLIHGLYIKKEGRFEDLGDLRSLKWEHLEYLASNNYTIEPCHAPRKTFMNDGRYLTVGAVFLGTQTFPEGAVFNAKLSAPIKTLHSFLQQISTAS